jgi:hypothetical protein
MVANVRTIRRIGQAKVKEGRDKVLCAVFEAQWPLTCTACDYTIQPGEWFTRVAKRRGEMPTDPVCRHCRPFTDVKVSTGPLTRA